MSKAFCIRRHRHSHSDKCDFPHDPRLGLCIFGDTINFDTGLCAHGHSAYGFNTVFTPNMVVCIIYKNILEQNNYKLDDKYNKMLNSYNKQQIRLMVDNRAEIFMLHDTITMLTGKLNKSYEKEDRLKDEYRSDKKHKRDEREYVHSDKYYELTGEIAKLNEQIKFYKEQLIENEKCKAVKEKDTVPLNIELEMANLKIRLLLDENEKLNEKLKNMTTHVQKPSDKIDPYDMSDTNPYGALMSSIIVRNSELAYNYETIEKQRDDLEKKNSELLYEMNILKEFHKNKIDILQKEIDNLKNENDKLKAKQEKYNKFMESFSEL